jgi:hypothetical protein
MPHNPPTDDDDREPLPRGQGRSWPGGPEQQPAETDPEDIAPIAVHSVPEFVPGQQDPGPDPSEPQVFDVSGFPGEIEPGGGGTGTHIQDPRDTKSALRNKFRFLGLPGMGGLAVG